MVTTQPVDQFEWATVKAEMQERGTEIRCKVHQRFKGVAQQPSLFVNLSGQDVEEWPSVK